MTGEKNNYLIEQFTLKKEHFKELSELITKAFLKDEAAQKEGASIVFTKETFNIMFGPPSINKQLFVRAKHKPTKEIVGFIGMIPRRLAVEDKEYDFCTPAWLAVHPEHQKQGLAKALGNKLMKLAIKADYDGAFALHELEQHGKDVSKAIARDNRITLKRLVSIDQFVIRVFDTTKLTKVVKIRWYENLFFRLKEKIGSVDNPKIRLFEKKDLPQIIELMDELVQKCQIAVVHDKKDISWLLQNPQALCVVHEDENQKVDGFIFAWEFLLAGFGNKIPFGWLDIVHTNKLSNKAVKDLANFLCKNAKERGWQGLQTPYIPYFLAKPFKKANFIFFPKKMTLDVFEYKEVPFPKEVESFYFNWR